MRARACRIAPTACRRAKVRVWCVDYYIRNKSPRLRTLGADPAGPYRLLTRYDGPVEVSLSKLVAALRGKDRVFRVLCRRRPDRLHADEVPA